MKDESTHTWLQLKGRWHEYKEVNDQFNIGFLGEVVLSSKSLLNNYTATVLQAPAFTPTPHSRIVFNEAFRANQYVAAGLSPIIKMGKLLHLRLDLYGFAPLNEIKKETFQSNQSTTGFPITASFSAPLNTWEKQRWCCNSHSCQSVSSVMDTAIRRRTSMWG